MNPLAPVLVLAVAGLAALVWQVRSSVRLRTQRAETPPMFSVVGLAKIIGDASTFAEVEAAVAQEIVQVLGPAARWAVLTSRFTFEHQAIDRTMAATLSRVLDEHPDGDPVPRRIPVRVGETVAVPCGAGSDFVLVVVGSRIDPDLEPVLGQIALIAGFGARIIAGSEKLAVTRTVSRFEEIVRYATDAILVSDAQGCLLYVAPSVTMVLGYRAADMEGRSITDLLGAERADELAEFLAEAAAKGARDVTERSLEVQRADGATIHVDVVAANLLENDDVRGIVVNIRDVTERRRLEDELRHHALHDGLTGLPNRTLFVDRVRHALGARRTSDDPQPAVAYVHLGGFGALNVAHGNDFGDRVLQLVGERLTVLLRGDDTVARVGGSDFALVLNDVADAGVVDRVSRRAIEAVLAPISGPDGKTIHVAVSVGAALATTGERDPDPVLRRAETASHRARRSGPRSVVVCSHTGVAGPTDLATAPPLRVAG